MIPAESVIINKMSKMCDLNGAFNCYSCDVIQVLGVYGDIGTAHINYVYVRVKVDVHAILVCTTIFSCKFLICVTFKLV